MTNAPLKDVFERAWSPVRAPAVPALAGAPAIEIARLRRGGPRA